MTARLSPPLSARTRTVHRPIGPASYDCVQLVVVRDGTAIVFSEFGEQPVSFDDAILLGPNVLCGTEPEGQLTVTTIYIDTDLALDQYVVDDLMASVGAVLLVSLSPVTRRGLCSCFA